MKFTDAEFKEIMDLLAKANKLVADTIKKAEALLQAEQN